MGMRGILSTLKLSEWGFCPGWLFLGDFVRGGLCPGGDYVRTPQWSGYSKGYYHRYPWCAQWWGNVWGLERTLRSEQSRIWNSTHAKRQPHMYSLLEKAINTKNMETTFHEKNLPRPVDEQHLQRASMSVFSGICMECPPHFTCRLWQLLEHDSPFLFVHVVYHIAWIFFLKSTTPSLLLLVLSYLWQLTCEPRPNLKSERQFLAFDCF